MHIHPEILCAGVPGQIMGQLHSISPLDETLMEKIVDTDIFSPDVVCKKKNKDLDSFCSPMNTLHRNL